MYFNIIDLAQNPIAALAIVAPLVQLLKPFIEVRLKPTDPLHDPTLRALSLVLGVVVMVAISLIATSGQASWPGLATAVLNGVIGSLSAGGFYHYSRPAAPAAPPVAPVPPPPAP